MAAYDEDLLDTYLRLLVDLRCPPGGGEPDVRKILKDKYQMAPQTYVSMTRAISKRPDLVRRLTQDAQDRCAEYRKLREVMSSKNIVRVLCRTPKPTNRSRQQRFLEATWRKFDIDPSWYLPLVEMLRQDPVHAPRLAEIDSRCNGATGAVRKR